MQNLSAAAPHAQAVDLSNLFAGIWMDNADDEDTPESGELDVESGSCLKRCSLLGSRMQDEMPHMSGLPAWAANCSGALACIS